MKERMQFLWVLVLMAFGLSGFAQNSFFVAEDKAAPFQIRYTGSEAAAYVMVTNSAANLNLKAGATTTAIDLTSDDTVAKVIGKINAATNAAGRFVWEAVKWAALDADVSNAKFVDHSDVWQTLQPNVWSTPVLWDTSAIKDYNAVPDSMARNGPMGSYVITGVYGDPAGTGTQVLKVYDNETLVYQKTFTQAYGPASAGTTVTNSLVGYYQGDPSAYVTNQWVFDSGASTNDIVTPSAWAQVAYTNTTVSYVPGSSTALPMTLDAGAAEFPRIKINPGRRGLVRVTRGSTATGGGIGATSESR